MKVICNSHKKFWAYGVVVAYFICVVVSACLYGENLIITVHDNLNDYVPILKSMRDNNLFFSHGVEIPMLHGYSRDQVCSEIKLYYIFFAIFPTFTAYIITYLIKTVIAVAGAVLLGKELTGDSYGKYRSIMILCGFSYGLLPYCYETGYGIISLPILLFLILKLHRTKEKKYFIFLFLFPILSDIVYTGIFACFFYLLFWLYQVIKTRKANIHLLLGLVILSVGYFVTDYRMLYETMGNHSVTIREDMPYLTTWNGGSIIDVIRTTIKVGITGYYNSGQIFAYVIFPTIAIVTIATNICYITGKTPKKILKDPLNLLLLLNFFNALLMSLTTGINSFVFKHFRILGMINFGRIEWLNPTILYICFVIALCRLRMYIKWSKIKNVIPCFLALMSAIVICITPCTFNHIYDNLRMAAINIYGIKNKAGVLSFKEFYSEKLFRQIKDDIGYQGEYAIAFGFQPAVLIYNNIATLDGYSSHYPLEYKYRFYDLIAPEFEVDKENKEYFEEYGALAYIYSNEISYDPDRYMGRDSACLRINSAVFKEMDGKYIFSRVEVRNAKQLGFDLIGEYSGKDTPYRIWVYSN